jgi:hypothetical protein
MENYLHVAKVGRRSAMELTQSYLKSYVATWWRIVRQGEGNNHGYTWEFFKDHVKTEFVPRNSDYISRCKLHDVVNATNENLRQYVRAYSELMFEIQHMYDVATLALGSQPKQGVARLRAKWKTRESHHMLLGVQRV